jgi:hypothetical protein
VASHVAGDQTCEDDERCKRQKQMQAVVAEAGVQLVKQRIAGAQHNDHEHAGESDEDSASVLQVSAHQR